jgi:hypothetical protein
MWLLLQAASRPAGTLNLVGTALKQCVRDTAENVGAEAAVKCCTLGTSTRMEVGTAHLV